MTKIALPVEVDDLYIGFSVSARTSESEFELRRDYARTRDSAIGKAKVRSQEIYSTRKLN